MSELQVALLKSKMFIRGTLYSLLVYQLLRIDATGSAA